jgi:transposase
MRAKFLAAIETVPAGDLIFLDESGTTTEMTRRYGRGLIGERVTDSAPGTWRTLTVLGAISVDGWVASMAIESPTDGDVFKAFLQDVLCPQIKPENVVVMDNLAAHKVDGVRQIIESAGATIRYLPPYSPDLNPIELCWSQFKQRLRSLMARTVTALDAAVGDAQKVLTKEHVLGYFRHCGYTP